MKRMTPDKLVELAQNLGFEVINPVDVLLRLAKQCLYPHIPPGYHPEFLRRLQDECFTRPRPSQPVSVITHPFGYIKVHSCGLHTRCTGYMDYASMKLEDL